MANANQITVEVIYANPQQQKIFVVKLLKPARVRDAIEQSHILTQYPDIDLQQLAVGVWGKVCSLDTELSDHDRVEIYRPLMIDPKQARLLRANKK